MAFSYDEAKAEHAKSLKMLVEGRILEQWYWYLMDAMTTQEKTEAAEIDLSSYFFMGDTAASSNIRAYDRSVGYDAGEHMNGEQRLIELIKSLIGDQLDELGLALRVYTVNNGLNVSRRIYFLRPDQEPTLPW